ncbi:MAG: anti-sigma factor antagonist [Prevotella sp.]|nr:anti-sigma factor antagonist [Prevotella sp.]
MTIQFTNNNGDATITLCGRLDTSVSTEIKSEIDKNLAAAGNINSLTMDAEGLEYISSSGLRILLVLAKSYKNFKVVNVNPDVYDVLNMTGFSKIINVERALRQLSIDGCEQIGVGGVGTVYRLDGDTIIKVFREGTTIDEVRKEITMSKEAFVMGTPTAISFDIVKVGSQYGLVYELLNAETLSSCIKRAPERIEEFARQYANLFRQLHSIEVPADSNVPDAIEHERQQILHIRRYFPQESIDLLLQILDAIPTSNRLLHLDLQVKNTMMQGDELMLIDMGEMGYGHPVLDLGHAYSAMVLLIGDYDKTIGIPRELGNKVWDLAINYYFEGQPADVVELRKAQIDVVARIRNFSWLALSDSFPESVIKQCQELFDQRITARRDYILDVCKTFKDWTL